MQKLWVVVALMALASPAAAGPIQLEITNAVFDGNLMHFDLVIVDNGNTGLSCEGFGAAAVRGGADAARFVARPDVVAGKTAPGMQTLVAPATYAWANAFWKLVEGASNFGGETPIWMGFKHETLSSGYFGIPLNSLAAGTVVARFYFELTNPGDPVREVRVDIMSYSRIIDAPVFTPLGGGEIRATVVNDGANIVPEPATMALVLAGLATLIVRRRVVAG